MSGRRSRPQPHSALPNEVRRARALILLLVTNAAFVKVGKKSGVTKAAEVRRLHERPPPEGTRASFRCPRSRPLVGGRCGFCCVCRFPHKPKRRCTEIVRPFTRRGAALQHPAAPRTAQLPRAGARQPTSRLTAAAKPPQRILHSKMRCAPLCKPARLG